MHRFPLSALLTLCAAAAHGQALPPGDAAVGKRLAQRWCVECHVIEPTQPRRTVGAVPAFPAVANQPSTTEMSLRAFLGQSHPNMPNFRLTRQETDDLIAFILSLRTR